MYAPGEVDSAAAKNQSPSPLMFLLLAMELELPVWYPPRSWLRLRSSWRRAPRSTPSSLLRSTASCGVSVAGWHPHGDRSAGSAGDLDAACAWDAWGDCEKDDRETLGADRGDRCSWVRADDVEVWSSGSSEKTLPRGERMGLRWRASSSSLWWRGRGARVK